ncbi:hypothetical protein Aeh1ORF229c [Aeromonas phage Aeh1]|uniref:Uncharacterized protein n=1 Tax=Aeromonas phage Aeh1 TaxID=2880362 RepID=Q76YK5_9CAUD|nr:hypothetical protein Aeh1p240 [Aeromonas phage Aeh1]AAQ17890.1 hypothetical protein Aeh1ORF229c [Aeromonas phage Aeh1]
MQIQIDEMYFEQFVARMEKLGRIAAKMGIDAPTFEIISERMITDDADLYTYKSFVIEVKGDAPKMPGGWTFVAKIDHDENLVYGVREIPEMYSSAADVKCKCDHCNTNRYRANTFVVTDGEKFLQVGGSCLKHYMGHASPKNMIYFFDEMKDLDNEKSYGSSSRIAYDTLEEVICASVAAIRRFGYVKTSHGCEDNVPTRYVVSNILHMPNSSFKRSDIEVFKDHVNPCVEFMFNMKPFGDGSYTNNVHQVAKNGYVSSKSMAYAVSAVACYLRDLDKKAEQAITDKIGNESKHIGSVGERLKGLELIVTRTNPIETMYGTLTVVSMIDNSGNMFTWFASGYREFDENEQIKIAGTVKAHDEYKGKKQTVLTRCKLVD